MTETRRYPEIVDAYRLAGLIPDLILGWETRGSAIFHPDGSTNHHTASPIGSGVQPALGIVIAGRPDLDGPLANTHGPREESYRINLVAAGKANHAGPGNYNGLEGNSEVFGHEEEFSGTDAESISELRIDRMARVHAANHYVMRTDPRKFQMQHYEWAKPAGRKIDFLRSKLNPDQFRARVYDRLVIMVGDGPPAPTPSPLPPLEDDDMLRSLEGENADGRQQVFWLDDAGLLKTKWQLADGNWSGEAGLGGGYVWRELTRFRLTTAKDPSAGGPGRIEVYGRSGFGNPAVISQVAPNGAFAPQVFNL